MLLWNVYVAVELPLLHIFNAHRAGDNIHFPKGKVARRFLVSLLKRVYTFCPRYSRSLFIARNSIAKCHFEWTTNDALSK